jgi:hypothetical protein
MAEQDTPLRRPAASSEDVKAVATRLEMLFHSMAGMHDLCEEQIGKAAADSETVYAFVIMRDLLRSAARDLEVCSETVVNNPRSLGYFEHHFGKI